MDRDLISLLSNQIKMLNKDIDMHIQSDAGPIAKQQVWQPD